MPGGNIHADGESRQAQSIPVADLAAGLAQYPFADIDDQPGFFGHRDEFQWRNRAAVVIPAYQGFTAYQLIGGELDLRLVFQIQLLMLQGMAQTVFDIQTTF